MNLKELTVRGLIIGALITFVFTAANVFLGLKVGLTFSSSIPAAVISMAILRAFKSSTIQENNIVQTVASAAGTLSAVIFVLPGLIIIGWWTGFPYWQSFAVCALGGILGVMYSIPLRRALVTNSDLPYPEGVAAAEVLRVGASKEAQAEGKEGIRAIVIGSTVSAGFTFASLTKVWAGEVAKYFKVGAGVTGVSTGFSFALLGAGHLVGLSVGMAMLAGIVISWIGAVPYLTNAMHIAPDADLAKTATGVFRGEVRFLGAGVIGVAAIYTLFNLIGPVVGGLVSALNAQKARKAGGGAGLPRTEQDIPIGMVGLVLLASFIPIGFLLWSFAQQAGLGAVSTELVAGGVAFIVLIGLLVAAVVGYMAGLIGASNSPLSGIGILSVVVAAAVIAAVIKPHVGEGASMALVAYSLFVTAVVFTCGTIANDNLQDLKTGQLVDATPWKQQVALVFGVIAGAIVIPPVLVLLSQAYGFAGSANAGPNALGAPQANLISDLARGVLNPNDPKANHEIVQVGFLALPHLWGRLLQGAILGVVLIVIDEVLKRLKLMRLPPLAVGLGIYLPMATTAFVVVGAVIGRIYEALVSRASSGEIAKRLGVLIASGLIVGDGLFGVLNAGIVVAAQAGYLAPLGISAGDPRAENPLGIPAIPEAYTAGLGVIVGIAVFALATLGMYVWSARAARRVA